MGGGEVGREEESKRVSSRGGMGGEREMGDF